MSQRFATEDRSLEYALDLATPFAPQQLSQISAGIVDELIRVEKEGGRSHGGLSPARIFLERNRGSSAPKVRISPPEIMRPGYTTDQRALGWILYQMAKAQLISGSLNAIPDDSPFWSDQSRGTNEYWRSIINRLLQGEYDNVPLEQLRGDLQQSIPSGKTPIAKVAIIAALVVTVLVVGVLFLKPPQPPPEPPPDDDQPKTTVLLPSNVVHDLKTLIAGWPASDRLKGSIQNFPDGDIIDQGAFNRLESDLKNLWDNPSQAEIHEPKPPPDWLAAPGAGKFPGLQTNIVTDLRTEQALRATSIVSVSNVAEAWNRAIVKIQSDDPLLSWKNSNTGIDAVELGLEEFKQGINLQRIPEKLADRSRKIDQVVGGLPLGPDLAFTQDLANKLKHLPKENRPEPPKNLNELKLWKAKAAREAEEFQPFVMTVQVAVLPAALGSTTYPEKARDLWQKGQLLSTEATDVVKRARDGGSKKSDLTTTKQNIEQRAAALSSDVDKLIADAAAFIRNDYSNAMKPEELTALIPKSQVIYSLDSKSTAPKFYEETLKEWKDCIGFIAAGQYQSINNSKAKIQAPPPGLAALFRESDAEFARFQIAERLVASANWTEARIQMKTWPNKVAFNRLREKVPEEGSGDVVATKPPTVSISGPANNATFPLPGEIPVQATAMAGSEAQITQVEFFDNNTSIGIDATAPYSVTKNFSAGAHSLTARATDSRGASTTSIGVTITVSSVPVVVPDPPTVSISRPPNKTTVPQPGEIIVEATATAGSGARITQVEFFDNNTSIGIDATAPYSVTKDLVIGTHSLTARATDSRGASTTSSPVAMAISPNVPPQLTPGDFLRQIEETLKKARGRNRIAVAKYIEDFERQHSEYSSSEWQAAFAAARKRVKDYIGQ